MKKHLLMITIGICLGVGVGFFFLKKTSSNLKESDNSSLQSSQNSVASLPEFSFADQTHQPFGTKELRGNVWVASFIFTRCGGTCPLITQRCLSLYKEFKKYPDLQDVCFVSFSVDPVHDTSEVLSRYANGYGISSEDWRFLTGSREAIWDLSKKGFKLAVGDAPENKEMPIFHSSYLVLIDRYGKIHGFYDGLDDQSAMELQEAAKMLASEPYDVKNILIYEKGDIGENPQDFFPEWLNERGQAQKDQASSWQTVSSIWFSRQGADFAN